MMRKKLPAGRAVGTPKPLKKPTWAAAALAVAVVMAGYASEAQALALGRITVQSALGEVLRADIELPDINAEEVASLRAAVASPNAFRAAGMEYSSALTGLQITLQRHSDGRYFLRLSSDRPVNDPFVDLILEASWASGRIVRDYTLLFDPPTARQSAPPVAPQVSPRAPAATAPGAAPRAAPAPSSQAAPRPPRPAPEPQAGSAPAERTPAGDGKRVTVQSGDTAGRIAAANKPAAISLDQMLVALLRSNPDAFVGDNMNRLKAGSVLQVPSAEQAGATSTAEASQSVIAQSRDFNEFRRRLAEGLQTTQVGAADRQSSGKVQAQVEEKKPSAAAPDKLTLSKSAGQGKAAEEKIARDRAAQDAATRVAELNKNISDLNKLGSATAVPGSTPGRSLPVPVPAPMAAASAARSTGPGLAVATLPVPAAATMTPPAAVASAAVRATPPAVTATPTPVAPPTPVAAPAPVQEAIAVPAAVVASAAAVAAVTPATAAASAASPSTIAAVQAPEPSRVASAPQAPAVAPPSQASLADQLLENPIVPAAAGALLALLLGFGFYRARQRKKSGQIDSSFLESRLQPDSFFGASGGQQIDTNEDSPTGSSMVYSPSQLDAAGDVDPVAEADVYLAYGRDLQAEEILKEALRTSPQRVAVHSKLLEIYSKRRDGKAFEQIATEAYGLTRGEGPEWEHICQMGHELDATNPLYRPGGHPGEGNTAKAVGTGAVAVGALSAVAATRAPPTPAATESVSTPEIDLDLDFSLGDEDNAPPVKAGSASAVADFNAAFGSQAPPSLDLPSLQVPVPVPAVTPEPATQDNSLDFSPEPVSARAPAPEVKAAPAAAPEGGMMEFDLGGLSLDLDPPAASAPVASAPAAPMAQASGGMDDALMGGDGGDTSLSTKLALAEEFNAIGDPDGARSLAEEVVAEASGELKNRAQRFLAEIA